MNVITTPFSLENTLSPLLGVATLFLAGKGIILWCGNVNSERLFRTGVSKLGPSHFCNVYMCVAHLR